MTRYEKMSLRISVRNWRIQVWYQFVQGQLVIIAKY